MPLTSIAAHFDGEQVRLDEFVDIRPNTRLTILEEGDPDREDFLALAATTFADSYGDGEVEYTEADLK